MSAISTITLHNAPGGSALAAGGKTNILNHVQGEVSVRRELNGTDQLSFTLQLGSPFHDACLESDYFSHRQTVKVEFADESVEYWVVNKADADYSGAPVTVECWPYWVQLDRRKFRRNLAPTGYADLTLSLVRVTAEEAITELLAGNASSVFTFGSVHSSLSSSLVSIELNNEDHLTGLRKILRALAEDNGGYPAEFVTTWSGGTCSIHVVPWVGASEAEILAGYTADPDSRIISAPIGSGTGKTRIMNRMTRGGRDEFNRVIPVAGRPEELVTIARATWPVSSAVHAAGSTTITVTDTPFQGPGVFTGMYFGKDTFYEITAVNDDDEIVVSGDASALTEGRVALSSTGDELSYLQTSEASGDDVSEKAVQVDVAPYHNILEDIDVTEDMSTWVAGDSDNAELPQGVGYKDADLAVPTITKYDKATYPAYVRDGDFSCHVNAVEGQGITIGEGVLSLDPSDDVPDHCFSVSISVISGVVRAVLVDSDGKRHPQGSEQVETDSKAIRALTVGGIPAAAGAAHLEVYAIGDAAEFVVNGVAVTNSAYAAQYSPQMGPRWIWKLGMKYLREQGGSRPTFETKFIDPTTYPGVQSSAEIGSWVRIKDAHDGATYQVNTTGRVQRLTHSYDTTGDPIIKLAQVTSLRPTFVDRILTTAARGQITEQAPRSNFGEVFESQFSKNVGSDAVATFRIGHGTGPFSALILDIGSGDIAYGTLLEVRGFDDEESVSFYNLEPLEANSSVRVEISANEPAYDAGFEGESGHVTNRASVTFPESVAAGRGVYIPIAHVNNILRQTAEGLTIVQKYRENALNLSRVAEIGEKVVATGVTSITNLSKKPRVNLRTGMALVIMSEHTDPQTVVVSANTDAGSSTIPIYSASLDVRPGDTITWSQDFVEARFRVEPAEIEQRIQRGQKVSEIGKVDGNIPAGNVTTITLESPGTNALLRSGETIIVEDRSGQTQEVEVAAERVAGTISLPVVNVAFGTEFREPILRYPQSTSIARILVAEENINLRVEKNDVINQINISTEGILIDGENIQIDGTTTFATGYDPSGSRAVIRSASEPTERDNGDALQVGDMWLDTANGDLPATWNGSAFIDTYTQIDGGRITTGQIESANWGASAGSQIDLTNGTFKYGGSSSPKFSWDGTNWHVGSATSYLKFDGTNVITTGKIISTDGTNIFTPGASDVVISGTLSMGASGEINIGSGDVVIDANGITIDDNTFFAAATAIEFGNVGRIWGGTGTGDGLRLESLVGSRVTLAPLDGSEGVAIEDSFLEFDDITAPGTTTNRLYAVSGDLYWNGVQIS